MNERAREFVAEEGWFAVGVATFGIAALTAVAGLSGLTAAVAVVGWFLLTPAFLFWGEEITAIAFEGESEREVSAAASTVPDDEEDALGALKRRYAAGEIDDDEFEHRLERLVAVEDLPPRKTPDRERPEREREFER